MRFATVEHKGKTFVGVVDEAAKSVTALMTRAGAEVYDINEVIRSEGRFDSLYAAKGPTFALSALKLKAPIPVPVRNIMCVGKNYREQPGIRRQRLRQQRQRCGRRDPHGAHHLHQGAAIRHRTRGADPLSDRRERAA